MASITDMTELWAVYSVSQGIQVRYFFLIHLLFKGTLDWKSIKLATTPIDPYLWMSLSIIVFN